MSRWNTPHGCRSVCFSANTPSAGHLVAALLLLLALGPGAWGQGTFRRGDSNQDGAVDLSDGIHSLNYLFQGGSEPTCFDAADSNDDGKLDISDPIATLNFLFVTGVPLPPPSPDPGLDPTADDLTCGDEVPGLEVTIELGPGIDPGLITGLELVFDSAPGGPPLDLSSFPGGGGGDGAGGVATTPMVGAQSVDRDPDLELVIEWTGNPFDGTTLSHFLAAAGLEPMPASLTANLFGSRGILASALAYQLPSGEPLVLGGDAHLDLDLLLACAPAACEMPGNQSPVLLVTDVLSVRVGTLLEYPIVAFDPDGDSLTLSGTGLGSLPGSPQLDAGAFVFRWTAPATAVRDDPYAVTLRVTDGGGASDSEPLRIVVLPPTANSRPVLAPIPPQLAAEGRTLEVSYRVLDPDGDDVSVFLDPSGLPATADASISETFRVFNWTPAHGDGRDEPYSVRLVARDEHNAEVDVSFPVQVGDVNRPPIVTMASELTVRAGVDTEVPFLAVDPDGDAVTVELRSCEPAAPFPAALDAAAGVLRLSPGPNDGSNSNWCFGVVAFDDGEPSQSAARSIRVRVSNSDAAPRMDVIRPQTAVEGTNFSFGVTAVDPEGSTVTVSLDTQHLPAGNDATLLGNVFRWTPAAGTARDMPYSVTVRASDPGGLSSSQDVFITVTPRDTRPPAPPRLSSPDTRDGSNDGLLVTGAYDIAADGPADAARIFLFRDGAPAGDAAAGAQGDATLPFSIATCGMTRLTARAQDLAGNLGEPSAPLDLVFAGALSQLQVQSSSTTQSAGSDVTITITARDLCGNPVPGHTAGTLAIAPQSSPTLGNGEHLAYAKVPAAQPGVVIPAGPGAVTISGARFDPHGMYFLEVTDTRAETVRLNIAAGTVTGSSPDLVWRAGAPARTVVVLPGQTLESGVPTRSIDDALPPDPVFAFPDAGTGGTREHAGAGETFTVRVIVTDDFFNVVEGSSLPAGFAATVSSPMDPGAGTLRLDAFLPSRAEASGSYRSLLARLDSHLTTALTNPGAITAFDSRPYTVRPGPTAGMVVVLPNQSLVSGVPVLSDGSPDLRSMVTGTPFGAGEAAQGERFQVQVFAADRHGNVNFNESRPVLVAADRALEAGVEVLATNPVTPGSLARISGPFSSSDFPIGSLVRVADASGAEYARVVRVDNGLALTVDRLDRSFVLPRVNRVELAELSDVPNGGPTLVGQRFGTLLSAEDAATTLPAGSNLRIVVDTAPALSATVDLSGLTSGAAIAGALESRVRAQAGDSPALGGFTARFQPEFHRYLLVSGRPADLGSGLGPVSATLTATTPLKLDPEAGAVGYSAAALSASDLANLGTARSKLALSGGRAIASIDLAAAPNDEPQAVAAILEPRQGGQQVSASTSFTVRPSTPAISTVELRDLDANGSIDRAEVRFSEPLITASTIPPDRMRFELGGTFGPVAATVTAVSPLLDSRRLTLHFGAGLPTTSIEDVALRVGDATLVRPVAGAPGRLIDLGAALIDKTSTGGHGLVLVDKAPPVVIGTEAIDADLDGRPEQVRLVFSEDISFQASRGVAIGRILPDLGAVQLAAGDTLAVAVDSVPRTFTFSVAASGADAIATTVRSLFERTPPQGFGTGAPDVSVEPQPFGAGGRFVIRSPTAGAGSSVRITGGTGAAKLGFDGTQLERPGSDGDQPDLEDFLVVSSSGVDLLAGMTDTDIIIDGNRLTIRLNDQAPPGDGVSFAFIDDFNGTLLADAAGNSVSLATNLAAAALNPSSSGFIRIRDDDGNRGDGIITRDPGIIRIDPAPSLIDRSAVTSVTVDILDTGADPFVFLGSLGWAKVTAPDLDVVPMASLDQSFELAAYGRGANGAVRIRIAVDPAAGSPLDLFTGADGRVRREFTIAINNLPPVADAGAEVQVVAANTPVQLDGRGSADPNAEDCETTADFLWEFEESSGAIVRLNGARPTFTFTELGAHTVTLRVTDAAGDESPPDHVTVVVASNTSPVVPAADAGPDQVVRVGELVTLDARGSRCGSPCGALRYEWDLVDDDGEVLTASIFPTNQATPTFTAASSPGYQNIRCTVTDANGDRASAPDTVRIIVVDPDAGLSLPVARIRRTEPAASGAVPLFDPVVLSASGSQGTRPVASHGWRQVKGVPVPLTANGSTLTVRPAQAGTYTFELVVIDAAGVRSVPAQETFVATDGGAVLEASAGPDLTTSGPVVSPGAGASFQVDPSLGAARILWSQSSGVPVVLQGATSTSPTFTPPVSGVYGFRLSVRGADSGFFALPEVGDEVLIGVSLPGNPLPAASLAATSSMGTIALDGSGSTPAGAEHHFAQTDGISNVLELVAPDGSRVEFDKLEPAGPYRFALTVFDAATQLRSLPASTSSLGQQDELTFTLTAQPTSTTAGVPFTVAGELRDAFGALAVSTTMTASVHVLSGPAGATLGGTITLDLEDGQVAFDDLTVDKAGTYQLQATGTLADGGELSATTGAFENRHAAPVALVVNQQPLTVTAGSPFTLRSELRDAFGNLAVTATASAIVTLASSPSGSTLSGTTVRSFEAGTVAFLDLAVDKAGPHRARIEAALLAGGTLTVTTGTFDNGHATPTVLVLTSRPGATTAGSPFTLAGELEDAFGNQAVTATATATVTLDSAPAGSTLGGTTVRPFSSGAVAFTNLTVDKAGSHDLRLDATLAAGGGLSVTSGAFTNGHATPVKLVVTEQPASTTAGSVFDLEIEARDAFENPAVTVSGSASVAIVTGPPGGALGGTTTRPVDTGRVAFHNLTVDKAGSYQLRTTGTLSAGGTLAVNTGSFSNGPAPATALVFRGTPAGVTAGGLITPAVEVELRDSFQNLAVTTTVTATMALDAAPPGAGLGGTTSVESTGGVARFTDLVIDTAGDGFRLRATAPGLAAGVSGTFSVAGAGSDLAVTDVSVPPGTLSGAVPVTFTLQDSTSDRAEVVIEFRRSPTDPFQFATQAGSQPGSGFDGLQGITTSPGGTEHTFLWNSSVDLPRLSTDVTLRVTPFDAAGVSGAELSLPGLVTDNGPSFSSLAAVNLTGSSFVFPSDWNRDGREDLAVGLSAPGRIQIFNQAVNGSFSAGQILSFGATPTALGTADFFRHGTRSFVVAFESTDQVTFVFNFGMFFSPTGSVTVGDGPADVVTEDFNNDHRMDAATANRNAGTVSIVTQSPTGGSFSLLGHLAAGAGARSITTGDFNRDGRPDLATANFTANTASVLIADPLAPGSFFTAVNYATGTGPSGIAAADFNRDGKLDLAVVNTTDGSFTALPGAGDGTFGAAMTFTIPDVTQPDRIAVADFDKDRRLDVAVGGPVTSNVAVFLQDPAAGDGFGSALVFTTLGPPRSLETFELNRDGRADIVINHASGVATLRNLLPRSADPLYQAPASATLIQPLQAFAIGDLNGDGKLDLAATSGAPVTSVAFGTGNGALVPGSPVSVGIGQSGVAVGRVNPDQLNDIIVALPTVNAVEVLTQDPGAPGTFVPGPTVGLLASPSDIFSGRFNNDSSDDFLVISEADGTVTTLLGTGSDLMRGASVAVGNQPSDLAAGDFNQDGMLDFVVTLSGDNAVRSFTGDGAGMFSASGPPLAAGTSPTAVDAGDLNGDSYLDLAVTSSASLRTFLSNQLGGFTAAPGSPAAAGTDPVALSIAAVDGDNDLDILVVDGADGGLLQFPGLGTGGVGVSTRFQLKANPNAIAVADLDDDVDQDVAVSHLNGVVWTISIGAGGLASAPDLGAGTAPVSVASADLNGDGKRDIVVTGRDFDEVLTHLGDGQGGITSSSSSSTGDEPVHVASGDLDGDGDTDALAVNFASGDVSPLLNGGAGDLVTQPPVAAGPGAIAVALGDFNHDSILDFTTANSGANSATVRFGSTGSIFQPPRTLPAGDTPVFVAVSDFNEDGCLEIAIVNQESNNFMVYFNQSDGSFTPASTFATGTTPRTAFVMDLDLNGTRDIVLADAQGVSIHSANGTGGFGPRIAVSLPETVLTVQATGPNEDADDDGRPELVATGEDTTFVLKNSGALSFATGVTYGTQVVLETPNEDPEPRFSTIVLGTQETPIIKGPRRGGGGGGCAIGRFEHLGGPTVQRLAALLTVAVPFVLITLLKRRARREWQGRSSPIPAD